MNRFVRKAAFSRRSPYWSVLPYNANWMLAENDPLISSLSSPIVFVDVGCRGGLPKELRPLRRKIHLIGFDADADECTRMNQENHGLFARAVYPFYISGRNGRSVFKLYKERGNSSSLDPDSRFSARFGGSGFSVDRTIELGCVTLDDFFREHPEIEKPDMIKLDTQGTELEVLTGAVECLETCSLVEVEVEFLPMYKDQALISEVMTFMADHGFELLYLNRVFQQQRGYPGIAKGQLTFGDALFVRREDCLVNFNSTRLVKLMTLLVNYGHLDAAYNLLNTENLPDGVCSFFSEYLKRRVGHWRLRKLSQCVIPLLDKFILLLLHMRRHNSLRMDSDRSWPVR